MKIIIVDPLFSPLGGGQIIAYNTYKLLKLFGQEVFYWATDRKPYFEEDYKYAEFFTKCNLSSLDYIKNPIKYYYNFQAKEDLDKFIDVIKPDLIHIHGLQGLSSSIFNSCKNIPTVMTLHDASLICPANTFLKGDEFDCINKYCQNGKFFNCLKYKCCSKLEPSLRRFIRAQINLMSLKNINKFITPSNKLRERVLRANIGINESDIVTINNFLSKSEYNIKPNFDNNGYFLYAGRLSKEKGVHYLLQVLKELPKEIVIHIVGKGPDEEKLKQYVKENGLNNIKFLGFKNREEIKEEYQNCIATILPCNWFEIFGMTNIEAFINGKPVIASNIGAIPEVVEHNKTGLLFEPANVEQLKECILKYWNNPKLVVEHGKNAYEKAKTQYTEERYYNDLLNVYSEVLNNAK